MCCLYSSIYLLSSENNSTVINVKIAGNKSEYTLSDNSYMSFNHANPHVLFIMLKFLSARQDHKNVCIWY